MTDDLDIRRRISELAEEEKRLRERNARGSLSPAEGHDRLHAIETELDQCWDLLRQREGRRDAGENPDGAAVRPASTVENYLD